MIAVCVVKNECNSNCDLPLAPSYVWTYAHTTFVSGTVSKPHFYQAFAP
jgi:hypothetical protein